jgi:hypothetical protein
VIERPGQTPRSPLIMDEPVLVTVEPPATAKLFATPRLGAMAVDFADTTIDKYTNENNIIRMIAIDRYFSFFILFSLSKKITQTSSQSR